MGLQEFENGDKKMWGQQPNNVSMQKIAGSIYAIRKEVELQSNFVKNIAISLNRMADMMEKGIGIKQ